MFGLGARWGIGHSTGLLLVGGIFILKDYLQNDDGDSDPSDNDERIEIPEVVTHVFESLVGIFMLLLGIYGIYEAMKLRNKYSSISVDSTTESHNHDIAANPDDTMPRRGYSDNTEVDVAPFELDENSHSDSHSDEEESLDAEVFPDEELSEGPDHHHHHNDHHHHHHSSKSPLLALCAGIFHGLAGPGGVLGVVPAIQLHNAGLATCYLLSFCISSTLTMGTFAAAYGSFTKWLATCCGNHQGNNSGPTASVKVEFGIRCFSASLSLLVGVLWLVLLAMGKLEDVFG